MTNSPTPTPPDWLKLDDPATENFQLASPLVWAAANQIGSLCDGDELGMLALFVGNVLGGDRPAHWFRKIYGDLS